MPKHSGPERSKRTQMEQLNQAMDALLAGPAAIVRELPRLDPNLISLTRIAQDLRDLPRPDFKARLKSELERKTAMPAQAASVEAERTSQAQQSVIAILRVKNAESAIKFYEQAFGAREILRFNAGGRIAHAELAIGNSTVVLADESPEYGFSSPEAYGGSPVAMEIFLPDADAAAAQAIAAGAKVVAPVIDQFYGVRSGQFADPFGYIWTIATRKEDLPLEEMYRRFEALMSSERSTLPSPLHGHVRAGFRAVTPYLITEDVPALIDFLKSTFRAEELSRDIGSAGGFHAEVRIADSMLMIGGGGPGLAWRGASEPMAFHVYVEDVDAAFQRALDAGAERIQPVAHQPYGERGGSVRDRAGNHWYIATGMGKSPVPEGANSLMPYLHPLRAEPVIRFLRQAFGGGDVEQYPSPDGVIHHAKVRIGDSVIEMGEANGPYQQMPSRFYLYVPDVDAMYRRALVAGAVSTAEPADQPYGDRLGGVKDVFGNQWYIATHRGAPKP